MLKCDRSSNIVTGIGSYVLVGFEVYLFVNLNV